jgi:hypothetical protein
MGIARLAVRGQAAGWRRTWMVAPVADAPAERNTTNTKFTHLPLAASVFYANTVGMEFDRYVCMAIGTLPDC